MTDQKPKCEDIGFEHAWTGYWTPAATKPEGVMDYRRCINCGKCQKYRTIQEAVIIRPEIREWRDV